MRSIQLLLQMQEHHVMVDLLKKLVLTIRTPILPSVDLNFERALHWVMVGAQPTDTVRNILSREGVYMKKHLLGGVAKGAFGEAEADAKFEAWKNNKQSGLAALKAKEDEAKKAEAKARLEAEKKVNEEKAKALAEKKAAEKLLRYMLNNDYLSKLCSDKIPVSVDALNSAKFGAVADIYPNFTFEEE